MRRLAAIALAGLLLVSVPVEGATAFTGHRWHYVDSYIYTNGPMGLWQVLTRYGVRLNGYTVQTTERMECSVPYAVAVSIDITYCHLDKLWWKHPVQWRVTTRWRMCFIHSAFGFCAARGHSLSFTARGTITARRSW